MKNLKILFYNVQVLITPHQAFATQEALSNIAETTFRTIDCWKNNKRPANELTPPAWRQETEAFSVL